MAQPRLNLRGVSALLVDRNHYCRALVAQMLRGFGLTHIGTCESAAAAMDYMKHNPVDLCLIEADLPDMTGADLIRWIRREQKEPLRFVPIIVLSGYTQLRMLTAARNAGANLVLKKPLSTQALFDRIAWIGRTKRAYIETANYVGPDRRFHNVMPPDNAYKRETDNSEDVAAPENTAVLAESATP